MSQNKPLPRILIIDDLFGRAHSDRRNEERATLCGQYLIEDITGDEVGKGTPQIIKKPIAQAVFHRGQKPLIANVGDIVQNDLEGTLEFIRRGWSINEAEYSCWSMILLDLCFYTGDVTQRGNQKLLGVPDGVKGDDDPQQYFGLQLLQAIHDQFPDLPVVILSSKPREEVAREFAYRGALGFLPREDDQSPELLEDYIWRHGLIPDDSGMVIGQSRALLLALRTARRTAASTRNLLIRGERGTGKDLLARYIHLQAKKKAPFIEVNSALLSSSLFASELFGIEKHVATGVERREGLIKAANGGDLFFDEIRDMPSEVQAGVLRVLEERKVTPVGSKQSQSVDIRFLSATNMDIEALAATGGFRSDLLDRLREGGTVFLPALRERKEDIPLIVERFVREAEEAGSHTMTREIDPEVMLRLCAYDWPGNIRELRSCIFRAVQNHPDVEHLVPIHLEINETKTNEVKDVDARKVESRRIFIGKSEIDPLTDLLALLEQYHFDDAKPAQLAGNLSKLQDAFARLLTRYLRAALIATKKSTLTSPEGEIFIHPALKLMTGDSKLLASKAADLIKRILGVSPEAVEQLLADPILREAYDKAIKLRPLKPNNRH